MAEILTLRARTTVEWAGQVDFRSASTW